MTGEEVDPRAPLLKKSFYLNINKVLGGIGPIEPRPGNLATFQLFADLFDTLILQAG
jgi:hypothetical protein